MPARGHFPTEAAVLTCAASPLVSLDPAGEDRRRVDHALEGATERLPDRLRRPPEPKQPPTTSRVRPGGAQGFQSMSVEPFAICSDMVTASVAYEAMAVP